MKKKRIKVILALVVALIIWNVNHKIASQDAVIQSYEEKIIELNEINISDADKLNREFLNKFFTYESTPERYEVKSMTTPDCYASLFPSGEITTDSGLSSALTSCESYKKEDSKDSVSYLNQLEITIEIEGKESIQRVFFETKLNFIDEAWRVSEVEFLS